MKKALFLLAALVFLGVSSFAQSTMVDIVKFKNEKLEIYEIRHGASYSGKWINSRMLEFVNNTNFEMEVRCSYTIDIVALTDSGRNRTEKKTNELVKLKPQEKRLIQATNYRLFDETFFISFNELINFRVLEKNYEIR
jgi:hypothetical protein